MQLQNEGRNESVRPCYACKGVGGRHAAICRDLFHDVCELEFSDDAYGRVHSYSVDSYVLQHPKDRGNKFNAFHLLRLYWLLHIAGPDQARSAGHRAGFTPRDLKDLPYLEPPTDSGSITVSDIGEAATAEEHGQRVLAWAKSVWNAWSAHHDWAVAYYETAIGRPEGR